MGQSRSRLQQMIAKYPHCAFCGGAAPTTSVEHMPSRVLFDDKWRPRGLEFPSCQGCQDSTRKIEPLIGMVSRFYPDSKTPKHRAEFLALIAAAKRNNPGLLEEMQIDQVSVLQRIGAAASRLPHWNFVNLGGPIIQQAIRAFGRKMALALHFDLTGKIVPAGSRFFIEPYTNASAIIDGFPEEMLEYLGPDQTLRMGKADVFDQFAYKSAEVVDAAITTHMAYFRQSLAMLLIVYTDPKTMTDVDLEQTVAFF